MVIEWILRNLEGLYDSNEFWGALITDLIRSDARSSDVNCRLNHRSTIID